MKVSVINKSKFDLPKYATLYSAGMDVRGDFDRIKFIGDKPQHFYDSQLIELHDKTKIIEIKPGGRCLIPTGLFVAIPIGYEIQCRMRSGLALKMGLTLTNGIGTIDADYRGEIGIILTNTSNNSVIVNDGERLMQIVLAKHEVIEWESVDTLAETVRGEGGFGHTGV